MNLLRTNSFIFYSIIFLLFLTLRLKMKKSRRKGQIELSANFIIVIIISIIIVVGGLAMFFRMIKNAKPVVDALDSQTEERIKSMMLSDNEDVVVYPSDPVIGPGDAKLVGVGVTNNFDNEQTFSVDLISVQIYKKDNPVGEPAITDANTLKTYMEMTSTNLELAPHSQGVKGMLLRMPSSVKGQYVYTIKITNSTGTVYGIVQVYANNP